MKKKILSLIMAMSVILCCGSVFAENVSLTRENDTRAIVMCYDGGTLVYSNLLKGENGIFDVSVPEKYDNTVKKLYFVETGELKNWEDVDFTKASESSATAVPSASPTSEPSPSPAASAAPQPAKQTEEDSDSPYEKGADKHSAPAMVTEVEMSTNSNEESVYVLTLFHNGTEKKIEVEEDLKITSAPEVYAYLIGSNAGALDAGDIIYYATNVAGDQIMELDLITRPAAEDIVTGGINYGTSFEQLFVSGDKVAGRWDFMRYGGNNSSSERYQYVYGIVGRMEKGTLTLLNTSGVIDDAIDISVDPRAYVYVCDVDGKNYETEIGDVHSITTSIPKRELLEGVADLGADYSYNYALVRVTDGNATDIALFNNYNN